VMRAVFWAGAMPTMAAAGLIGGYWFWPALVLPALALPAYATVVYRAYRGRRQRGNAAYDAWLYGLSCVAAKFPQLAGQVRFWTRGGKPRRAFPGAADAPASGSIESEESGAT
jgi:hypothetical protein